MRMLARNRRFVTQTLGAALTLAAAAGLAAAQQAGAAPADRPAMRNAPAEAIPAARLVAEPASLALRAGQTVPFRVRAFDANGREIANPFVQVRASNRGVRFADTTVTATAAGRYEATAMALGANGAPISITIPITVTWPALTRLEIAGTAGPLYAGLTQAQKLNGWHADGSERTGLTASWRSSDPRVATVNRFGDVTALAAGTVTVTAEAEGVKATRTYTIGTNPVARIEIGIAESQIRTGDVLHLKATARRANGQVVADAPITWSYTYVPDDSIAPAGLPGGAGIVQFDRFAANYPGRYTLLAQSGGAYAQWAVQVNPRDVRQRIQVTGRGNINATHTSDLWPWTGKNGRDYVLVGTWGGDGYALVFDITDMDNIVKTDSVRVDARTINDVTVSPDGRYGVLSREGASNRVNGVVILDLADPAHPKVASTFDQELTGGVHNMFATNDYLFAISGGAKYVIIDVRDIYKPKYVSEYRHPNARIHDLWVRDGIAYSAQGGVGVVVVDVGNGRYGGSIENPKLITTYRVNSGHEIFPYFQQKTGRTYLFIGDEEMSRRGRTWEGTQYSLAGPDGKPPRNGIAQTSGGYTHIVDFTDPMHPIPVGRYHLEDYGSHDIIVEDDILYQAYYDGGVRVVDVSGELLGNIYDQNREIAVFKPYDPDAYTPNAPFVMNAMPWKGRVLFTDFNSGLWAAKLLPKPVVQ
ncbi:MAG: Ig-like domain-containing protein [Gemmatimonadaceae bacterium]|nr:Ig-like domain-containing protein [Gemmatimonadaceae bacterium]